MKTIRINLMYFILVVFIIVSICISFFRVKKNVQIINTNQIDTFLDAKEIQATVKYNIVDDFYADGTDNLSDSDAFQNALNMAKGNKEIIEIYVPKGIYIIDNRLSVFSNTIISLDDEAILESLNGGEFLKSYHLDESGDICPQWKSCNHGEYSQIKNVLIQGGIWNCNGKSMLNLSGFTIAHGQNIIIKNTCLKNCAGHAINVSDSCDILIDHVTIENQISSEPSKADDTNEAIHLDYAGSGEYGSTWGSYPIDGTPVKNVVIQNCTFSNVLCGIGSHTTATEESSMGDNILIQKNNFNNIKCYAMNLFAHKNVKIINNIASGNNPNNILSNKNEAYAFVRGEYLKAEIIQNTVDNFETTIVKNDRNNTFFDIQTDDNNYINRFFIFKYIPNGGTGYMSPSIVEYGITTKISKNTFTRIGYKFNGWNIYRTYPGSSVSQRWYCGKSIGWKTEQEIINNGYNKAVYKDEYSVQGTSPWHHSIVDLYAVWIKMNEIEVSKLPSKLSYIQNEEDLDLTEGKLTIRYEDNTSEVIDLSKASISGFDNSIIGEQIINVEYEGLTTSYKVTVEKGKQNLKGDINENGEIDISDILQLERHIACKNSQETASKHPDWELKDEKYIIGDVNENSQIDIGDVLKLLRYMSAKNSNEVAQKHPDWLKL